MTTPTTRSLVIEGTATAAGKSLARADPQRTTERVVMEIDFQPVVGHKFNFRAKPMPNWNGIIDCEVLVVEPNQKLSYSWGSMGMGSVVAWTLTATSSGTLVRMEQSGFGPDQEANYQGAKYGCKGSWAVWNEWWRGWNGDYHEHSTNYFSHASSHF